MLKVSHFLGKVRSFLSFWTGRSKDLKQRSVLVKGGKQEKQRAASRAEGGAATGVTSEMRMPDVPFILVPTISTQGTEQSLRQAVF